MMFASEDKKVIQLDLFGEEECEIQVLKKNINSVKKSSDNVRRGIFARHAELEKKYLELYKRIEIIEKKMSANVSY